MGITNVPWDPKLERRLIALWRRGLTGERIAAELGVSRSAVLGKAARLGLYRQQQRVNRRVGPAGSTDLPRMTSAAANAIVKAIPPDKRTLMQRFFGDPPAGRSALDRKLSEKRIATQFLAKPVNPGFEKRLDCGRKSSEHIGRPPFQSEVVE